MQRWLMLLVFLIISFLPATLGLFFGPGEWFANINKPSFMPPDWVFAPVWTILYFLMGVSVWLVWDKAPNQLEFEFPRNLFLAQLFFNALWTPLFFGLHHPGMALVDIIILWLFILTMIYSFFRLSKLAALLQLPYLAWVTFASYLNLILWQIN